MRNLIETLQDVISILTFQLHRNSCDGTNCSPRQCRMNEYCHKHR